MQAPVFSWVIRTTIQQAFMRYAVTFATVGLAAILVGAASTASAQRFVAPGAAGRLAYPVDARGNRLPEFSSAGYGGGATAPRGFRRRLIMSRG
jgi:hypothetical protein